jgi:hypothetical protein
MTVRRALARLLLGGSAGSPRLDDGHLLMQLRAAHGFFVGLPASDKRRRDLERRRSVLIADRRPIPAAVVVPTAPWRPGFASDLFIGLRSLAGPSSRPSDILTTTGTPTRRRRRAGGFGVQTPLCGSMVARSRMSERF